MAKKTISVQEIKKLIDKSELVHLLGDMGGKVQITGEVYPSNVVKGHYAVETEIGTVYLDDEGKHFVSY